MNYSCEYQTEIQSALWSRASITLFTAAAITKDSCQSFLICSGTKDKDTVAAFLFALYENHLFPSNQVDEEIIWSDGPTSEFKNKFIMKLLHQLSSQFQKRFSWKFSATSHGKDVEIPSRRWDWWSGKIVGSTEGYESIFRAHNCAVSKRFFSNCKNRDAKKQLCYTSLRVRFNARKKQESCGKKISQQ